MNGVTFKNTLLSLALLGTAFLSSLTFANAPTNNLNNTKMFRSKLGCMACHQSESMQSDKTSKKNQNNQQR